MTILTNESSYSRSAFQEVSLDSTSTFLFATYIPGSDLKQSQNSTKIISLKKLYKLCESLKLKNMENMTALNQANFKWNAMFITNLKT